MFLKVLPFFFKVTQNNSEQFKDFLQKELQRIFLQEAQLSYISAEQANDICSKIQSELIQQEYTDEQINDILAYEESVKEQMQDAETLRSISETVVVCPLCLK